MIYGTLEKAMEYDKQGKIDEWLQLFLRNDGNNVALADGLLLEEREYIGIVDFNLALLKDVEAGAPNYLTRENDKEYFFQVVDRMKQSKPDWDIPPLIIEFQEGEKFYVDDGRHRLEMYRQLGINKAKAVLWTTGLDRRKILEEKYL